MTVFSPYYQEDGITIYHGDCRDILPTLEPVDLVLTDPPYVFGIASTEWKTGWGDLMNASVWYASWLIEAKRLTKSAPGSVWVFNSWRSFPVLARASYDVSWPIESLLVWDKDWIGPGGVRGLRPQYELIALFVQPGFAIKNRSLPDVWRQKWMSTIGVTEHRAEKPVGIMAKIIKETEARSVLDPFMGSGTSLIAARQLGRKAVGIEIEEKYCKMAIERLAQGVLSFES
jgi:site-specific DNA-methyltransferase (adenine-specific)